MALLPENANGLGNALAALNIRNTLHELADIVNKGRSLSKNKKDLYSDMAILCAKMHRIIEEIIGMIGNIQPPQKRAPMPAGPTPPPSTAAQPGPGGAARAEAPAAAKAAEDAKKIASAISSKFISADKFIDRLMKKLAEETGNLYSSINYLQKAAQRKGELDEAISSLERIEPHHWPKMEKITQERAGKLLANINFVSKQIEESSRLSAENEGIVEKERMFATKAERTLAAIENLLVSANIRNTNVRDEVHHHRQRVSENILNSLEKKPEKYKELSGKYREWKTAVAESIKQHTQTIKNMALAKEIGKEDMYKNAVQGLKQAAGKNQELVIASIQISEALYNKARESAKDSKVLRDRMRENANSIRR